MRCDLGQTRTREPAAFPVIVTAAAPVRVLADEASGCIDAYTNDGDLVVVSGQFSMPACYQVPDTDNPDAKRSIEISGTFDARLPKRSSP